MDLAQIGAITGTVNGIQAFSGLSNFHRSFIQRDLRIVSQLTDHPEVQINPKCRSVCRYGYEEIR